MLHINFKRTFLIVSYLNIIACTNLSVSHSEPSESSEQIKKCEEVVRKILSTSPRYIALTNELSKNAKKSGSKYLGLDTESTPFDEKNDDINSSSGAYYLSLYEMQQERQLNVARFAFIYKKEMLYEIDMATNKWRELEFDTSLLTEYSCSK